MGRLQNDRIIDRMCQRYYFLHLGKKKKAEKSAQCYLQKEVQRLKDKESVFPFCHHRDICNKLFCQEAGIIFCVLLQVFMC